MPAEEQEPLLIAKICMLVGMMVTFFVLPLGLVYLGIWFWRGG
jgi:hypothetical protein